MSVLLTGLLRHYPGLSEALDNQRARSKKFRRCLSYIEEYLSADPTVNVLAEMECLRRNAFTRAFKSATGVTPRAYLNSELNQRACSMIVGGGLSMREIYHALGFRDEYCFNRFFKKMNGIPPLRYRKSLGRHPAARPRRSR